MEYDSEKLTEWCINGGYEIVLKNLPVEDEIRHIVERGIDEIVFANPNDKRLHGQTLKCFLDKSVAPPLIHVHVDGRYAGTYFYGDSDFAKRSNIKMPS